MTDEHRVYMSMTVAEAAAEMRVSRAMGYRLAAAGVLRTVTVGRRKRVLRAELERMIAEGLLETARA